MTDLNWSELWDATEQRYRVMTRDGRKVRIFVTDARDPNYPIIGEVDDRKPNGGWTPLRWMKDGSVIESDILPSHSDDLIAEPRTVRRWVNVYRCGDDYELSDPHDTLEQADAGSRGLSCDRVHQYVATVPVEWEE